MSQLTGTIPLVEISGASHEYETLTGVRESVLDINIKQIILTSDFEFFSPQVGF
jgi:DNA-directed RNA polymerase alpha subunit